MIHDLDLYTSHIRLDFNYIQGDKIKRYKFIFQKVLVVEEKVSNKSCMVGKETNNVIN